MISMALLPIILFIVFIGVLFLFSNFIQRVNSNGKNIRRMLIGYFVLLIISAIVYGILPIENNLAQEESVEPEDIPQLFNHLNLETLDEVDSSIIRETWEFELDDDEIQIEYTENDWGSHVSIFVDQVENLEGKVEATYYQNPTFVEGINIAKYSFLPNINLSSGVLQIKAPVYEDLEFITFKTEFPFRQYTGEKLLDEGFFHGDELIYIRVPEEIVMEVDDEISIVE